MAKRKAKAKPKSSVEKTARRVANEVMKKHVQGKPPKGHGVKPKRRKR
ncbi:MAG: hypothetical protein ACR2PR_03455 [Pseudohongiellaceae bacterium]